MPEAGATPVWIRRAFVAELVRFMGAGIGAQAAVSPQAAPVASWPLPDHGASP